MKDRHPEGAGRQVGGIVGLLSRDFISWWLIASLIAFPIAWWACTGCKASPTGSHQLVDIRLAGGTAILDRFADGQRTDDRASHRKSHQEPEIKSKSRPYHFRPYHLLSMHFFTEIFTRSIDRWRCSYTGSLPPV